MDQSPAEPFVETEVDWTKDDTDTPALDHVYVIRNPLGQYYHNPLAGVETWESNWDDATEYRSSRQANDTRYALTVRAIRSKVYKREYRETPADSVADVQPVIDTQPAALADPVLGSLLVETDFDFHLEFRGVFEVGRFLLRDLTMTDLKNLSAMATKMQQEGRKTWELVGGLAQIIAVPHEDHSGCIHGNRGVEWFTHCRKQD